jgi:hypothetical protein
MMASERGALLRRLGDVIAENAEKLAELEVLDNGKLRAEMLGQMKYLPQWFYYYGGLADKIEGAVTPIDKPGMFHYIQYEPLGVVAVIAPWNSPPPRHNSCRPDKIENPGAVKREQVGALRKDIQGQSGGTVAAAGERISGTGCARDRCGCGNA